MKKALLVPFLFLATTLPSCTNAPAETSVTPSTPSSEPSSEPSSDGSGASSSTYAEEVIQLKALLAKQGLSPSYAKTFTSQFTQNYEAYSSSNGLEEETESRFYTYNGAGYFGCFYTVSEAAYNEANAIEDPDFFDYLSRGKGSYAMLQNGGLVSYLYETEGEKNIASLQSKEFIQNMDVRFTDENVQVVNSLVTKPTVGDDAFPGDEIQRFNGRIEKDKLFETITPHALSDIFARTNLFDGQRSCENIDRIYSKTLQELSAKSDEELAAFIETNDVRFEDDGENTLVHFTVMDEHLRKMLEEHDIFPGRFTGTLTYEKESGKFASYDYRIAYQANESDDESGALHIASMEFHATGYSWNQEYDGDPYINPNATVYEDAEAFLDDVLKEVIPSLF